MSPCSDAKMIIYICFVSVVPYVPCLSAALLYSVPRIRGYYSSPDYRPQTRSGEPQIGLVQIFCRISPAADLTSNVVLRSSQGHDALHTLGTRSHAELNMWSPFEDKHVEYLSLASFKLNLWPHWKKCSSRRLGVPPHSAFINDKGLYSV